MKVPDENTAEDIIIPETKKSTAKKKAVSKKKVSDTAKPVENPKTGWWDD